MAAPARFDIEGFVDPDTETVRLYAFGRSMKGDPCIEIPCDRNTLVDWAYLFLRLAQEDTEANEGDPFHLQGCFSTLDEDAEE